jgi:hypothetical protein
MFKWIYSREDYYKEQTMTPTLPDSRVFDPPNPNELTHPFRDY